MPTPQEINQHNRRNFLRQRGRLKLFAASEATVVLVSKKGIFQLTQLMFGKDGSFYCTWPYLEQQYGIVAEIEFKDTPQGSVEFSLSDKGKATSHLVKFAHHVSGWAHFSLSGKARNDVRRFSFPLTGPIGRLFEMQFAFPESFKPLTKLKPNRLYLMFEGEIGIESLLTIKGEWRSKNEGQILGKGDVGPLVPFVKRSTGEKGLMYQFAPPLQNPLKSHMLCIRGVVSNRPAGFERPGVIFMGGYDLHEVGQDQPIAGVIKGGLAAMYPSTGSDELHEKLGSIDIF